MLIVLVVIVYHGLRLLASQCRGAACDTYIPFSLLLPSGALVLAGVTGGVAAYSAREEGGGWVAILACCAVLGALGPVVADFLVHDNDLLVWTSTVLILTVPIGVALQSAIHPKARR